MAYGYMPRRNQTVAPAPGVGGDEPQTYHADGWTSVRPFSVGTAGNLAPSVGGGGGDAERYNFHGYLPKFPGASAATGGELSGYHPSFPGSAPQPAQQQQDQPHYGADWKLQQIRQDAVNRANTARNVSLSHNLEQAYASGDQSRADAIAGQMGMGGAGGSGYFANRTRQDTFNGYYPKQMQNLLDLGAAEVTGANLQNDAARTYNGYYPKEIQARLRAGDLANDAAALRNDAAKTYNGYYPQAIRQQLEQQQATTDATKAGVGQYADVLKQFQALQSRYDALQKAYMGGALKVAQAGGIDAMAPTAGAAPAAGAPQQTQAPAAAPASTSLAPGESNDFGAGASKPGQAVPVATGTHPNFGKVTKFSDGTVRDQSGRVLGRI